jgi:hypothetical protein
MVQLTKETSWSGKWDEENDRASLEQEKRRIAALSKRIGRMVTSADFELLAGPKATRAGIEQALGQTLDSGPNERVGQADLMILLRRMDKAIRKSLPLEAHGNSAFPVRDERYRRPDGTVNEHQGEHTDRYLAGIANNHGEEAANEVRQAIQRGDVLKVANKYKRDRVQEGTRASEDSESDDCEHPGGDIDGFIHPEYRARGWDPDTKAFQAEYAGMGVRDYYSEMYSRLYPKEISDQIVQGLFGDRNEENSRPPDMKQIRRERPRRQKLDMPSYSDDEWEGLLNQDPGRRAGRRIYGDAERDIYSNDPRDDQSPEDDESPREQQSIPTEENPTPDGGPIEETSTDEHQQHRKDPNFVRIDDLSPFRGFIKKARQYLKTKSDVAPGKQSHALSRALLRGELTTRALPSIRAQATKEAINNNVRSQVNQNEDPLEGMNKRTLGKYYRMAIQRIFSAAKKQAGNRKRVQRQEQSQRTKTYMRMPETRPSLTQEGTGRAVAPNASSSVSTNSGPIIPREYKDALQEYNDEYYLPYDTDNFHNLTELGLVDEDGNWVSKKMAPVLKENGFWEIESVGETQKSLIGRMRKALRKAEDATRPLAVEHVVVSDKYTSRKPTYLDSFPPSGRQSSPDDGDVRDLTGRGSDNQKLVDTAGLQNRRDSFWQSGSTALPSIAPNRSPDPNKKDRLLSYNRDTDAWEGKLTRVHSGILHPAVALGKFGYDLARAGIAGLTTVDLNDVGHLANNAAKDATSVAQDTLAGLGSGLKRTKDWVKQTIGPKLGFGPDQSTAKETVGDGATNPYGAEVTGIGGEAPHNSMSTQDLWDSSDPVHKAALIDRLRQHPRTRAKWDRWNNAVPGPRKDAARQELNAAVADLIEEEKAAAHKNTPDQQRIERARSREDVRKLSMEEPQLLAGILSNWMRAGDAVPDPGAPKDANPRYQRTLTKDEQVKLRQKMLENPELGASIAQSLLAGMRKKPTTTRDPKAQAAQDTKIALLTKIAKGDPSSGLYNALMEIINQMATGTGDTNPNAIDSTTTDSAVQAEQNARMSAEIDLREHSKNHGVESKQFLDAANRHPEIQRIDDLIDERKQQIGAAGGGNRGAVQELRDTLNVLQQRRAETIQRFKEQFKPRAPEEAQAELDAPVTVSPDLESTLRTNGDRFGVDSVEFLDSANNHPEVKNLNDLIIALKQELRTMGLSADPNEKAKKKKDLEALQEQRSEAIKKLQEQFRPKTAKEVTEEATRLMAGDGPPVNATPEMRAAAEAWLASMLAGRGAPPVAPPAGGELPAGERPAGELPAERPVDGAAVDGAAAGESDGVKPAAADAAAGESDGVKPAAADAAGGVSEPQNFSGQDLNGRDFSGQDLTGANLSSANLTNAKLPNAKLSGADLTGANLSSANLTNADLPGAKLPGAHLRDADLRRADLTGADLTGARLAGAKLTGASLTGANFTDADLTGADLKYVVLLDVNLTGADLTGVSLSGANTMGAYTLDDSGKKVRFVAPVSGGTSTTPADVENVARTALENMGPGGDGKTDDPVDLVNVDISGMTPEQLQAHKEAIEKEMDEESKRLGNQFGGRWHFAPQEERKRLNALSLAHTFAIRAINDRRSTPPPPAAVETAVERPAELTPEKVASATLGDLEPTKDVVDVDISDMNESQLKRHLKNINDEMTKISAEIMNLPNQWKSASMEQIARINALEGARVDADKKARSFRPVGVATAATRQPTSPEEIASLLNRTGARRPDTAESLRPTLETSPVSMEQLETQVALLPEADRSAMRESIAQLRTYQAAVDAATDPEERAAYQEEVNRMIEALRTKGILKSSLSRKMPRKFSKSSLSNDPKRLIMSIYNSL